MRATTLDTRRVVRTVALMVLVGPNVGVREEYAQAMLTAARTRTVASHLTDKGRLTVQHYHDRDDYRVTVEESS